MATQHQAPDASPAAQEPRRPQRLKSLLLLALILLVGTGLRLREIADPLQQDEFGPLYAVVEREGTVPGYTASTEMPLRPVKSWAEVRERSILPYGIKSPFPLYHYILYAFVHVLPINEVTLRLPSLLAGLGVIVTMYWLARTVAGTDAGLAAALLTAVEPMQIAASVMARPYALAVLAGMVSFLALYNYLVASETWKSAIAAAVLSLCTAFIGYMNPILILICLPQAILVLVWLGRRGWQRKSWRAVLLPGLGLAAACLGAALLLYPQIKYVQEVRAFNSSHREYLNWYLPQRGAFLYLHNAGILGASFASLIVGAIASRVFGQRDGNQSRAEAPIPPGSTDLLLMGLLLLLIPQAFVSLVDNGTNHSMFMSRYLVYTQLGWIVAFAGTVIRTRSPLVRWSALLAATVVFSALGFLATGRGIQLDTRSFMMDAVHELNRLESLGGIRPGDVLLIRSGFLEADLPVEKFPEAMRPDLQGLSAAPMLSLYPTAARRRYVVLGLSHRYGLSWTSNFLLREQNYVDRLRANQLHEYQRFWILDGCGGKDPFAQCILPRLANILNCDLRVAADPASGSFDFEIPRDIKPGDRIPELHGPSALKFGPLILVEREQD